MSSIENIDNIIKNLSQSEYKFGENLLTESEIHQIKQQSRNDRGIYGVNTPIGKEIFKFISQNDDIVIQLQDFDDSELDAMIIKYSQASSRKYIIINSKKPLINQIFAAAHEFYHYKYSFTGNTKDSIVCSFNKDDKEEIKANRFAAEFLLPEDALRAERESFEKYQDKFAKQSLARQIVFCFTLTIKYSLPIKAVLYRLKEEGISNTDYLIEHYADVKKLFKEVTDDYPFVKELYSTNNKYIDEQLYNLVPFLYNKGRLEDSTVDSIIKEFNLSESQIKGGFKKDE